MTPIVLWWIGTRGLPKGMLEAVRAHVERVFGWPAAIWHGTGRPEDTYDVVRGQHSSTAILEWLQQHRPARTLKAVAVTDVDLFIPVLTFVYGEAQLNGSVAVVSTARLASGSRSAAERLLTARLAKEIVHELGHTFALVHCDSPHCVMARSVSVAGIDAKGSGFCSDCRSLYLQQVDQEETLT